MPNNIRDGKPLTGAIDIISGIAGIVGLKNGHGQYKQAKTTEAAAAAKAAQEAELISKGWIRNENGDLVAPTSKQLIPEGWEQLSNGEIRPKVIAEAEINGVVFKDTNQGARATLNRDASKNTLISDLVNAKRIKSPHKNPPNGNMADAHGEIGAMQQAFDAGVTTNGQNMTIKVVGRPVCSYCQQDIPAMAKKLGLNSLTIHEAETGKTLFWESGVKGLKSRRD